MNLTCQQFVDLLYDFVEGELVEEVQESVRIHIEACPVCGIYVESYRCTKVIARALPRTQSLPPAFAARLETLLKGVLRQSEEA